MRGIISLLLLVLLTTSCATFQLTTLNHDPMYPDEMKVDVIDNEFQLARKLRTDDRFRWDFAQFAMRQDMRWNYDFYFNNRMYRSAFASPFDFYWNSNQYWYNWASNSHFNMGFNHWDTFGFYGQGMGWSYSWNNRRWSSNQWGNPYGWNNYYVVGGMTDLKDTSPPFGMSLTEIIMEKISRDDLVVCFDFPTGHIDDNRAMVLGANVRLEVNDKHSHLCYV